MSWKSVYGQKRASNKRLIQKMLDEAGLNSTMIAELAGVTRQAVSLALNGHGHSPKVLDALRKVGVAEKFLYDPHKQQETV